MGRTKALANTHWLTASAALCLGVRRLTMVDRKHIDGSLLGECYAKPARGTGICGAPPGSSSVLRLSCAYRQVLNIPQQADSQPTARTARAYALLVGVKITS